jgi:hypothetical protein
MQSALFAWKSIVPSVTIVNVDIPSLPRPGMNLPVEGRMQIAYNVTDLGNNKWHYQYVVYNMNSDRSARSLAINIAGDATCVDVTNVGFRDVPYHSGTPYNSTDWSSVKTSSKFEWACVDPYVADVNNPTNNPLLVKSAYLDTANALRWGTSYSFRFVSNRPPVAGTATIGMHKPATALSTVMSVDVNVMVPQGGDCGCDVDFNNNGIFPEDQDINDFLDVLAGSACVPCDSVDFNRNGIFPEDQDIIDFFDVLAGAQCPY